MNPPTVFHHLAGSLTQSIRSNEPRLIFTRDEEIGSSTDSIPLFIFGLANFEINMKDWDCEGRTRAAEQMKVEMQARAKDTVEERDMKPKRKKVWATIKE